MMRPSLSHCSLVLPLTLFPMLLVGCSREPHDREPALEASSNLERLIPVSATRIGFVPSRILVSRGERVTLRITRTAETTCAQQIVFPGFGLTMALPLNSPVEVEVPTGDVGELEFQCGVGMYRGAVVIN